MSTVNLASQRPFLRADCWKLGRSGWSAQRHIPVGAHDYAVYRWCSLSTFDTFAAQNATACDAAKWDKYCVQFCYRILLTAMSSASFVFVWGRSLWRVSFTFTIVWWKWNDAYRHWRDQKFIREVKAYSMKVTPLEQVKGLLITPRYPRCWIITNSAPLTSDAETRILPVIKFRDMRTTKAGRHLFLATCTFQQTTRLDAAERIGSESRCLTSYMGWRKSVDV